MSPTLYNTFTNASEITPYVEFIKNTKEIYSNYEDIQAPKKSSKDNSKKSLSGAR